jgi:NAD(P)-dependent dehydrogenase (short-subunit alcohol dehydrogenase family)
MSAGMAGRAVALIGTGSPADRAIAIACAEEGADLALATMAAVQEQEFALNSIANEAWALGREQFVTLLDALDTADVTAFADQVFDRYRRCDVLFCCHDRPSTAPLDELSRDEWDDSLAANLTAPFLAAQAFGRVMEREGGGVILLVIPPDEHQDASWQAARLGLSAVETAIGDAWSERGVEARVCAPHEAFLIARDLLAGMAPGG